MQETSRVARKLSGLTGMGFERVEISPVSTEAIRVGPVTHKVTSSRPAMGTLVSVTALCRSKGRAEQGIGRAFEEMDRLIGIFNRFDGSSVVTHLNEQGSVSGVPREFSHVVSRSLDFHELSRGAFDISVAPLVNLFSESLDGESQREPTDAEVAEALELTGAQSIEVFEDGVGFGKSGMEITLDGIAKGYIVDAIARVLLGHKLQDFMINAGGDIRTAGTKEKKHPWTIAVQDPSKSSNFLDTIHLTDTAVATSGGYEIYFDRDKQFHHIVSASTGRSPSLSASVSVTAPSAFAADALATGVFVMDPVEGIAFIDSLPGCDCLIVDKAGVQMKSRGWRSVAPVNGEKAET